MGFTAVLFCPDEKIARVVSLVLSELGFTVDPVPESFMAVNKLVAHHYDAIILDCDNIENSSLLLRSARSSSINQDSLVIALAEGQVGVANAYRIGANLVLTKPINVEQARGTLRVARGLLRKNADAASPTTGPETVSAPAREERVLNFDFLEDGHSLADAGADAHAVAEALTVKPYEASISAMSVPETGNPASASMPQARVETAQPEPQDESQQTGQFAKRDLPRGTAPNAGSLAGQELFDSRFGPVRAMPDQSSSQRSSGLSAAAAAAPALAKEQPSAEEGVRSDEEVLARSTPRAPFLDQEPAFEAKPIPWQDFPDRESAPSSQLFAGFAETMPRRPDYNKKILVAAIAVLAMAAAGYFGWAKFGATAPGRATAGMTAPASISPDSGEPVQVPTQPQQRLSLQATGRSGLRSNVILNSSSALGVARSGDRDQAAVLSPQATVAVTAASKTPPPQIGKPKVDELAQDGSSGWIALSLGTGDSAKQNPAAASAPTRPVVPANKVQAEDAAPPVPNPVEVSFSPDSRSLIGVLSSGTKVSTPTLASIRLSQGVSGGLLIKRVQPTYPASARAAHIQGTVEIKARIDKEGRVVDPAVLAGDRALAAAALDAVRQWRYKPYYLDGQAVEVETQIAITFKGD